jgi:hypothetical protein
MGLDVESRETLDEAIDRIKAAIRDDGELLLAHVEARLSDLVSHLVTDTIIPQFRSLIAAQDGWNLTVEVPKITIKLHKPPAAAGAQ